MSCFTPIFLHRGTDHPDRGMVPCGRCDACLLERSRQWAIRCVHELRYHSQACFLTLTYRDEELVYGGNYRATLVKAHLQNFWKRYRKELKNVPIRYFACGEYGSLRYRPHYHAIIFGHDFPDKKISGSKNGNIYYQSNLLDSLWTHGTCTIGDVSFESAAYIARYTLKKAYGGDGKKWIRENIIEPEFLTMSLKPGIGAQFYQDFKKDIYPDDFLIIRDGVKTKPPRYYNKLLKRDDRDTYDKIMVERKKHQSEKWIENTDFRRKTKAFCQRAKLKLLPRDLE